jgi:hypothetical protein
MCWEYNFQIFRNIIKNTSIKTLFNIIIVDDIISIISEIKGWTRNIVNIWNFNSGIDFIFDFIG